MSPQPPRENNQSRRTLRRQDKKLKEMLATIDEERKGAEHYKQQVSLLHTTHSVYLHVLYVVSVVLKWKAQPYKLNMLYVHACTVYLWEVSNMQIEWAPRCTVVILPLKMLQPAIAKGFLGP